MIGRNGLTQWPGLKCPLPVSGGGNRSHREIAGAEFTINQAFQRSVEARGDHPYLLAKEKGVYQPHTYREIAGKVRQFALGLRAVGAEPGDRVALLSENRPEWAIADLALQSAGMINVPLFATLPPPQIEYILRDSGARYLLVSTEKQLQKASALRDRLPDLRRVIVFDQLPGRTADGWVLEFREVLSRGERYGEAHPHLYEQQQAAVRPHDLATIIYTSGTTGPPKGAMLSHWNCMSNVEACCQAIDIGPDDVFLSFLPLSHVFERTVSHYLPMYLGATVAYVESLFAISRNLAEVRPTVMASVPRLYEKMYEDLCKRVEKYPPRKRALVAWAFDLARAYAAACQAHQPLSLGFRLRYWIADRLVFSQIRRSLGGRLRFFVSGGAPLAPELSRFFYGCGITILEGYGLTESSPVITTNRSRETLKIGTVGPPIPGVEVKLAEDGEILTRGPHVMQGYYRRPEATAEVIDADGWLHTGDIGRLDEDGYLTITDRKKDMLVLSNGKNVYPAPIENRLKTSPFIDQVLLLGDRQKSVTALIVPAFEALESFARRENLLYNDRRDLVRHEAVERLFKQEIDRLSDGYLADFERVKRFRLLPEEFSQEKEEVTPTLKLKRKVIQEHYADLIAEMAD